MQLACKAQYHLKTNTPRTSSGCTFMCPNKMLLLGAMEISGGKNSHGKNNTFLPSDRSTFAHLVQMLLYSCGCREKYWWEARSQKKGPFFCLCAEKDNCSSELTQDASLPFQWQHKLLLHSWEKSYVDLLSLSWGVCVCEGKTECVRVGKCMCAYAVCVCVLCIRCMYTVILCAWGVDADF